MIPTTIQDVVRSPETDDFYIVLENGRCVAVHRSIFILRALTRGSWKEMMWVDTLYARDGRGKLLEQFSSWFLDFVKEKEDDL